MSETPYQENPDFPAPETVIIDNPTAEHMAHAADPGYEELIKKGGRDITLNQAAKIGMRIGEDMEAARQNYVAQTAGSEALAATVTKHEPGASIDFSPQGYVETRRDFFEQNVETLRDTLSDIFNTIRGKEGYPVPKQKDTYRGFFSTEEVTLYDPVSRTVNQLSQTLCYEGQASYAKKQSVNELKPVDGTQVEGNLIKRSKPKGRLLVEGRRIEMGEDGEIEKYQNGGWSGGDRNPEDIIEWSKTLARSFPLKDPSLAQKAIADEGNEMSLDLMKVFLEKGIETNKIPDFESGLRAYYREPTMTRDLRKQLVADQEQFEGLKKPPVQPGT